MPLDPTMVGVGQGFDPLKNIQAGQDYVTSLFNMAAQKKAGAQMAAGNYQDATATLGGQGLIPQAQAMVGFGQGQNAYAAKLQGLGQAAQGDISGAAQTLAKTGDPATMAAGTGIAQNEQQLRAMWMIRAATMIKGIPAQPGDQQGSPNTPRAQAIQHLAPTLQQMGLPPEFIQRLATLPKDDASIQEMIKALSAPFSGTLEGQGKVQTAYVNGEPVARGYVGPEKLGPSDTLAPPSIAANGPYTAPAAPTLGKPGDVPLNLNSGQPIGPRLPFEPTPQVVPAGSDARTFDPNRGGFVPDGGSASNGTAANPSGMAHANNLLNLTNLDHGRMWAGQNGSDGRFARFATPEAGWAAADKNLQAYGTQHGINTVAGIVARWSPLGDGNNNPAAEAASIAKTLGVDPHQPLDLSNPAVRQAFLTAKAAIEQGRPIKISAQAANDLPHTGLGAQLPPQAGGGVAATIHGRGYSDPHSIPNAPGQWITGPDGHPIQVAGSGVDYLRTREGFYNSPAAQKYEDGIGAYTALSSVVQKMSGNGPLDTAAVDSYLRGINPGMGARNSTVSMFLEHLGLPQEVQSHILSATGNGYLTPQTIQQMLQVVHDYTQAHHDILARRMQYDADFARQNNGDPAKLGENLPAVPPVPNVLGGRKAAAGGVVKLAGASAHQQYAALPHGARFIDPNGVLRVKR